ncbi:MAG: hypothetical protein F6K17_11080 [Okeania sp. SIO3C4]|nr:hypothetical protein [Okeania sp. SIO3C4]
MNISGVGILPSQKYQERENIRNGKISGTGKYQERENIRNGKISGTGKMPIPQDYKTIKIIPHLCNVEMLT